MIGMSATRLIYSNHGPTLERVRAPISKKRLNYKSNPYLAGLWNVFGPYIEKNI